MTSQPGPGSDIPGTLTSRPARLGHVVLASLIDQVVVGRLPPGSSLPAEPVLCQDFGVSRSVIRESLKLLEEKGLVVVKQGHGTTVLASDQWNLLDPLVLSAVIRNDHTLNIFDDLVDVRTALESQMARRAATTITDAQLGQLQSQLRELETFLDQPPEYAERDLLYHDTISRFSGHELARSILRSVQPLAMASAYYGETHRTREDNVRSHRGHVAIFKQLAKRDPDGAARAVKAHILGSWAVHKESNNNGSETV